MSAQRVFGLHVGLMALVIGAGWLVAGQVAEGASEKTAQLGVALCGASGAVSLLLKKQARSMKAALAVMVGVFGARALLLVAGGVWAAKAGGGAMPFVWGFFGTYFPLQWVEISFLVAQAKRDRTTERTQ